MLSSKFSQRKPNRLKEYDYSQAGYYFISISTKHSLDYFGHIHQGIMCLNQYGSLIWQQWSWLEKYQYVQLDEFIVMPNHVHGILIIRDIDYCTDRSRPVPTDAIIKIKSISELMGAFKTTSSKLIHQAGLEEFAWHRSFYDHIISNNDALENIREYIRYNPERWEEDRYNKKGSRRDQTLREPLSS